MSPHTVLITGCSDGGIGSALAKAFASRGLRVFAAARSAAKMSALVGLSNIVLLELDVASSDSIAAAVKTVSLETGGTLDYLVNNAGLGYRSAAIEVDDRMARALFDVNFWGVVDMCRAFAPLVLRAKGTIVNNGSLSSRIPMLWGSVYGASKAAVETYSETLRLEMAPFGVKVLTILPGPVHTNMNNPTTLAPSTLPGDDSIFKPAEKNIAEAHVPVRMPAEKFAEKVVGDILSGATGVVWRGVLTSRLWIIATFFPRSVLEMLVSMKQGLDLLGKNDAVLTK